MFEFRKLASKLAKGTKDSDKDESLDLDIAQASHAVRIMREIAMEDPALVKKVLRWSDDSKNNPRLPAIPDSPKNPTDNRNPTNNKILDKTKKLTTAFFRS